MASLLFTIGGAVVNPLVFSGTNFVFSRLTDHGAEKRKWHDLGLEKLQRAKDNWNRDPMKLLDLINKRLRERDEAMAYIKNVDEAMLWILSRVCKKNKHLPPEPELSDFYDRLENQKTGELLFVVLGTGIVTYALYECLK